MEEPKPKHQSKTVQQSKTNEMHPQRRSADSSTLPSHTISTTLVTLVLSCCLLLLVPATTATSTSVTAQTNATASNATTTTVEDNFNCPADCDCRLAHNTHKPFLHAKCSSLRGLKAIETVETKLPIHSIDLSNLRLARLSHALDKLVDVTSIDLSHNELHEFGHLGRRIKKLNLKHNRITSAKLSKLPQHVQVLNLQHNDITYLPLEMKHLSNLQTLELSHNHINCSCETLEVRNWLQERHVFMEHPVTCSYPAEYMGKSWLQIKQEDVCAKEKRGWFPDEDENELMLGDQPIEGSADNEDEDEFGKAYLPIDKKASTVKSTEVHESDVEGSGDLDAAELAHDLSHLTTQGPDNLMARINNEEDEELEQPRNAIDEQLDEEPLEDEGSGSGGGALVIPHLAYDNDNTDDFNTDGDQHDNDSTPVEEPVETADDIFNRHMKGILEMAKEAKDALKGSTTESTNEEAPMSAQDVFNRHMGIFEGAEAETDKSEQTAPGGADSEDDLWPVVHKDDDSENVEGFTTDGPLTADKEQIQQAKVGEQDDTNATYFLFGVIGIIVIGLLLFVGIKRCKNNSGNDDDVENPRNRELLDMDKKNLGKPLRNGNENLPLIGEKTNVDLAKPVSGKKPYDGNDIKDGPAQQEPLINGNGTKNGNALSDNVPQINEPGQQQPHEYYPITPRYPTPQSPRASKYAQYPQGEPNNNNADDAYLPSSPKSGRYSPVYSPETGRVKIKLTETPRPKTPMLVTRSKSNAGDIVTTPVRSEVGNGGSAAPQRVY